MSKERKRYRWGILALLLVWLIPAILPQWGLAETGQKHRDTIYEIRFSEWVEYSLNFELSRLKGPKPRLLRVINQSTTDQLRFRVEIHRNWSDEFGLPPQFPEIKKLIEQKCRDWTARGYPISLNDFEFRIEPFY